MRHQELTKVLPKDTKFDFEQYRENERSVLAPAILAAGYQIQGPWFTGDGDSFGPLTRCIEAIDRNGKQVTLMYG